jgi:hypothetical protein
MRKFLFCFLIILLSGCASRKIQHGILQKEIKIGEKKEDILKTIGQESLESNFENCLYYITQKSQSAYFLRPHTLNFEIQKICFKNNIVSNIYKFNHQSKFNPILHKKLKSQDKVTIKDFFKEMINTSSLKS